MALDVSSIQASSPAPGERHARLPPGGTADPERPAPQAAKPVAEIPSDLRTAIRDLQRVSETFNRRLSFSINEKLGQVVVKVIDNDTDKVVREIPPVELQRVYERIREVIGLLFDKSA
jgi:flagellar protein FlaG